MIGGVAESDDDVDLDPRPFALQAGLRGERAKETCPLAFD
jgi:hypothetical protein